MEFSILSVPLLLLLCGLLDFGLLFEQQLVLTNGARSGGRYASLHPSALSNASTASSNTIQGQIQGAGSNSRLANDDSHISIAYYPQGSSTTCGTYSASTNTVTYYGGYTQATCLAVGNSVKVSLKSNSPVLTPFISSLYPGGVTTTASAAFLIEKYP